MGGGISFTGIVGKEEKRGNAREYFCIGSVESCKCPRPYIFPVPAPGLKLGSGAVFLQQQAGVKAAGLKQWLEK